MNKLNGFKYGAKLSDKLSIQVAIIFQWILKKMFNRCDVSINIEPRGTNVTK